MEPRPSLLLPTSTVVMHLTGTSHSQDLVSHPMLCPLFLCPSQFVTRPMKTSSWQDLVSNFTEPCLFPSWPITARHESDGHCTLTGHCLPIHGAFLSDWYHAAVCFHVDDVDQENTTRCVLYVLRKQYNCICMTLIQRILPSVFQVEQESILILMLLNSVIDCLFGMMFYLSMANRHQVFIAIVLLQSFSSIEQRALATELEYRPRSWRRCFHMCVFCNFFFEVRACKRTCQKPTSTKRIPLLLVPAIWFVHSTRSFRQTCNAVHITKERLRRVVDLTIYGLNWEFARDLGSKSNLPRRHS